MKFSRNIIKSPIFIFFAGIFTLSMMSYYAYPTYKINQLEKEIRQQIQALPNHTIEYTHADIKHLVIQSTSMNEYPYFHIQVILNNYQQHVAPPKVEDSIKDLTCDRLKEILLFPKLERIATLNVLKKDRVQYIYAIKNMHGKLLFKHQQVLAKCHDFQQLLNNTTSPNVYLTPNLTAGTLAPKLQ